MRCRHELQLMSGAAGAIAALALGPPALPGTLKKLSTFSRRVDPENRIAVYPYPPKAVLNTQKRDTFCPHNFFAGGLFRAALPLSERRPDVRLLLEADINARPRHVALPKGAPRGSSPNFLS